MIFACCQQYKTLSIYDVDTYGKKYDCVVDGDIRAIDFIDSDILVMLVDTNNYMVDNVYTYKLVLYNYNINKLGNTTDIIKHDFIRPKIKISTDGIYLILNGKDYIIIYRYDSENITEINYIVYTTTIYDFGITVDNCILINYGDTIKKYNFLTNVEYHILQNIEHISGPYSSNSELVILPNFNMVAYRVNRNILNIADINDFTNLLTITTQFEIHKIKFSSGNPNIVAISGYLPISNSISLQIWDIVTASWLFTLFDSVNTRLLIRDFTFDLNNNNILVLLLDGTIKIFNTLSGDELLPIPGFIKYRATVIEFQNKEMLVLW